MMSNIPYKSDPGTGSNGDPLGLRIGHTPLLKLESVSRLFTGVSIHAKAEWYNRGGSVKDRAAHRMLLEAELTGALRDGKTILDATSGNTGISYAWIGAVKGYPVRLVVPENVGTDRKRILQAYGAEVIYTDPLLGVDGAIEKARSLYAGEPAKYFYADQYRNPANWKAHYDHTAVEIWEQTGGALTHFVAGLGTSGTFVGTARRLKSLSPGIRCISVEPDGPFHGLEGLKHMGSAVVPAIYDESLADEKRQVRTEDAYAMARTLAREEGLLVGPSGAAAVTACVEIADELPKHRQALIVTVLPDSGDRYLSEQLWNEDSTT
ncbi:MAG: cysteine synthase family protein [Candidatus Krumholzibacteria bacterium]